MGLDGEAGYKTKEFITRYFTEPLVRLYNEYPDCNFECYFEKHTDLKEEWSALDAANKKYGIIILMLGC